MIKKYGHIVQLCRLNTDYRKMRQRFQQDSIFKLFKLEIEYRDAEIVQYSTVHDTLNK